MLTFSHEKGRFLLRLGQRDRAVTHTHTHTLIDHRQKDKVWLLLRFSQSVSSTLEVMGIMRL